MAPVELEPIQRLTRDLAKGAATLSKQEARFLVDAYYMMQDNRIRSNNQIRALNSSGEPHEVLQWFANQSETLEAQVKRALDKWTDAHHMGRWAKSVCGIGPVIAAGLLAHIDMEPWVCKAKDAKGKACRPNDLPTEAHSQCGRERLNTVGHIWRFAGLDPTSKWLPKTKRPWNASLKTLCAFKLGESFVKVQNNDNDVYGKLFATRKRLEEGRNDSGMFKAEAERILKEKPPGKTTDAYAALIQGRLPQAQIHARARRYAVKQFLSDYHAEAFRTQFGEEPPKPYPIAILGHAHLRVPKQQPIA